MKQQPVSPHHRTPVEWLSMTWPDRRYYVKFWRIITGQTRYIRLPIDVLIRVYDESPTMRKELDLSTDRAIRFLQSTNGVYARQAGKGQDLELPEPRYPESQEKEINT